MSDERTTYTERTPWAAWVRVILWGAIALTCYGVLVRPGGDLPLTARLAIVVGVAGLVFALEALLGGLTVMVQETRIFMHLGTVPLLHRRVPFSEIVSLESVRYRPLRDFGGWGIRGWGRRKAWSARGDEAVALTLEGDRLLLIGSDRPRRLEERIRAAMGEG